MPRYVIHTYTVTDPKTGRRWHQQNPWGIARLVMMHGDWKRYVCPGGPRSESDITWRITSTILNGTWDNQFPIEPDGEMISCYVPPETRHSIREVHSVAEALGALDRRFRNGGMHSEMVMASMLSKLLEQKKHQRLRDQDCELLDKIEGTFGFQTRREMAMVMLLWELRKEYEQRYCNAARQVAVLDCERERFKQIIKRIDDALSMESA
jgi:hypothetical protein